MKVVQINATCGWGSTGKIAVEISKILTRNKIENYIYYTQGTTDYPLGRKYSNKFYTKINALNCRILGNYGFNSKRQTKKLIQELEQMKPDVVHLHNIHSHDMNLELFFSYLKSIPAKIIWTFHDCWAFTAYCTHFDFISCSKWKQGCHHCPQYKQMSWFFDRSRELYEKKKQLFLGIQDLTIVTPSRWLADLTKQSFLGCYPVKVINNGINLQVFRPVQSSFREKYRIGEKYVILGIAADINERKGFQHYINLSHMIDSDAVLVLVGVKPKQIKRLPDNVLGIECTKNQKELAEIYTAADVFVNCTLEDNFPTVNLEALACGTPVITFETGGSVECADEETGVSVPQGNVEAVWEAVRKLRTKEKSSLKCRERALKFFQAEVCFQEYLQLYQEVKHAGCNTNK